MITRREPSKPPHAGRAHRRDAGITLIELVVAMTLFGIFLTIFTGAILSMYRSTNKSTAMMDSSAQLSAAYNRLDTSVRYASGIGAPVIGTDGNPYVAFQSTYTGSTVCTQLRVNAAFSQLQQRTWTVANGAASGLSSWQPLASEIQAAPGGAFTVPVTPQFQTLKIALVSASGSGPDGAKADLSLTFTAFNSTEGADTSHLCQEVGTP